MMYDYESFIRGVKKGLELEPSSEPPPLPPVPVAYRVVSDTDGDPSALVPLQIGFSAVKIRAEVNPESSSSSLHVRYRFSWHIYNTPFSSLILAVPLLPGGSLLSYEFKICYRRKTALKKVELDTNYKPHFQNIYLASFHWVEALRGCTQFVSIVRCVQSFSTIDHAQGLYSFSIPLSIPSYVAQHPLRTLVCQKIRLYLDCTGVGAITDHDISTHPFVELMTDDRRRLLAYDSRFYSDKDLACSFKITSPIMVQAKLYQEVSFIGSVEEGLKLISDPGKVSFLTKSFLPTAPVLYAVVSNSNILNIRTSGADRTFQPPALVPLQLTSLSVKINAEPKPDSVYVRFKGRWSVQCIKKGDTSPLILAVPVGFEGCLLRYEICVPSHSPTVLKAEEFTASNGPQFGNLYLLALPPCEGGADVCINFCYSQDVIEKQGIFSFTVPLSVPDYVNQRSSSKEKIRLTLECKDARRITKCDVPSHHLMELLSSEKMCVLLKESLGYSNKDLTCQFTVA